MKQARTRLRIGVGAGMADDRIGPALQLLNQCDLDYLVCECLAERTIARETLPRRHDGARGVNPMLDERMRSFLPLCRQKNVRLVSNMGAANPMGAAARNSFAMATATGNAEKFVPMLSDVVAGLNGVSLERR